MDHQHYLNALRSEIRPALGCTEPIAVALAVAKARETLGQLPEKVELYVSCNILKNAMGVGIPGTGMVGLEIASALSCVAGHSAYGLEVLSGASGADYDAAREYAATGCIHVHTKETGKKLYIEAHAFGGGHENRKRSQPQQPALRARGIHDGPHLAERLGVGDDKRRARPRARKLP